MTMNRLLSRTSIINKRLIQIESRITLLTFIIHNMLKTKNKDFTNLNFINEKKFAARYIDTEKTSDKKIVYEYRKQIQITIMR